MRRLDCRRPQWRWFPGDHCFGKGIAQCENLLESGKREMRKLSKAGMISCRTVDEIPEVIGNRNVTGWRAYSFSRIACLVTNGFRKKSVNGMGLDHYCSMTSSLSYMVIGQYSVYNHCGAGQVVAGSTLPGRAGGKSELRRVVCPVTRGA